MLKRMLPGSWLAALRDLRRVEPRARLRMLGAVFGRQPWEVVRSLSLPPDPAILFVCHGNILRSAAGEALLRQAAADGGIPRTLRVSSAGLHAKPGKAADPRGVAVAPALGVSLERHRAQPVTAELVDQNDLILVMDRVNAVEILARYPHLTSRVRLLGAFAAGPMEIADPYMGTAEDVEVAFRRVRDGVDGLLAHLAAP